MIYGKRIAAKNRVSTKLQKSLSSVDNNKFWKLWKCNFNASNSRNDLDLKVDNISDSRETADHLADSFKNACSPNDFKKDAEFNCKYFLEKLNYKVSSTEAFCVDVEAIDKAIKQISGNKAGGHDSLTIEHIKHAHPSLIVILAKIFTIMINNGLVPDDFGLGITKPIPKFKGNKKLVTADDFRGITICPIISKIFEYCLQESILSVPTSERQFGFKKGSSCQFAIHSVRKIINFYNSRGSTINIGIIDLKKAFDKVNHFGLLLALMKNNVDVKIINILENWLSKSCSIIEWNGHYSQNVRYLSGVRQGGILSPLLFTIFVDIVLQTLDQSMLGCYINFECKNSFMYADDIILLANTVTDLQLLLNLCGDIFSKLDLPINVSKSHCLRIGPRYKHECASLSLNSSTLEWASSTKFLGITICSDSKFKCCWKENKRKILNLCC